MASIGSKSVDIITGRPAAPAVRVETLASQAGEDYERYRKLGTAAPAAEVRTMKAAFATAAAADTEAAAYRSLIATRQTITDGHGVTWAECMIIDVATETRIYHTGAAQKWRVEAVWTVRQGNPSP